MTEENNSEKYVPKQKKKLLISNVLITFIVEMQIHRKRTKHYEHRNWQCTSTPICTRILTECELTRLKICYADFGSTWSLRCQCACKLAISDCNNDQLNCGKVDTTKSVHSLSGCTAKGSATGRKTSYRQLPRSTRDILAVWFVTIGCSLSTT